MLCTMNVHLLCQCPPRCPTPCTSPTSADKEIMLPHIHTILRSHLRQLSNVKHPSHSILSIAYKTSHNPIASPRMHMHTKSYA